MLEVRYGRCTGLAFSLTIPSDIAELQVLLDGHVHCLKCCMGGVHRSGIQLGV